jgi:3-oxoacyl-[acyl-carrier protein] reductase
VLINNAGGVAGQEMRPVEEVPDADWDRIFAINVGAAFALSRAAAAGMKRAGRGRIVNISSGAGLVWLSQAGKRSFALRRSVHSTIQPAAA